MEVPFATFDTSDNVIVSVSTETPKGYSYLGDGSSHIIQNEEGKKVPDKMRELTHFMAQDSVLASSVEQSQEKKERLLNTLHKMFATPSIDNTFFESRILHRMRQNTNTYLYEI